MRSPAIRKKKPMKKAALTPKNGPSHAGVATGCLERPAAAGRPVGLAGVVGDDQHDQQHAQPLNEYKALPLLRGLPFLIGGG